MESSFLATLRQSLPGYLVASLNLAGVTSLDDFLKLSDSRGAPCDVIPLPEVVNYLREQLPLLPSHNQLRSFLPAALNEADQNLETARRQVEHWNIPPGTKCLLFCVQADIRAQVEALELSTTSRSASASFRLRPTVSQSQELPSALLWSAAQHREPPDDSSMKPPPAKLPRIRPAAMSNAGGDVMRAPAEESEEGEKKRRTRKRSRRSKHAPSVPASVSSPAPIPIPVSSPAPVPIPVSRRSPRLTPAPPQAGAARLGHVIFDSDGEVAENREPVIHPHTKEVAQNRRQCKNKPNFEIPEMSKKAQINSRQRNRSIFLKNDGSAPEIPAHALRKQASPVAKIGLSPDDSSPMPPKKKALLSRGPKVVNVDLDKDFSSSSSSSSESESESKTFPPRNTKKAQKVIDATPSNQDSKDTQCSYQDSKDALCSYQDSKAALCSYQDSKAALCSYQDSKDALCSYEDSMDIPSASPDPRKDTPLSHPHFKDTQSFPALNGSHVESIEAGGYPGLAKCLSLEARDYSVLESLQQPPRQGSLIAFKVLELDPNSFTPEVSDFKEGRFLTFDGAKRRCQIDVLVNKRTSVGEGKFDVWMESSDGQVLTNFEEEEKTLVTSWDALQEVKLISEPRSDSC